MERDIQRRKLIFLILCKRRIATTYGENRAAGVFRAKDSLEKRKGAQLWAFSGEKIKKVLKNGLSNGENLRAFHYLMPIIKYTGKDTKNAYSKLFRHGRSCVHRCIINIRFCRWHGR
jgi:hypothetical protein